MSNVGYATLTVIPSAKGFGKALSGDVNPALKSAGTAGGGLFGGALGGAAASVLGPLAAGLGAIAVGGFVKSAVQAAGELEQSIGAVDVVFAGSEAQMHSWAKGAATAVGLSKNEYNSFAALLGSQLKNAGVPMEELGATTNKLIGYGADFSAMFGGTATEAVSAISSALKGEMDPIERYGITLNEAAIKSEAAALGFTGTLTQAQKAQAIMSLIETQGADAMGTFGREATTYGGVVARLSASWANISTTIGQAFLPFATAAASVLLAMMPTIQGLADGFASFGERMQAAFAGAGGGMEGIGAMFASIAQSIVGWITGGGLISAIQSLTALRGEFFSAILSAAPGMIEALVAFIPQLVTFLTGTLLPQLIAQASGVLIQIIGLIGTIVPQLLTALVAAAPAILTGAITAFMALVQGLIQIIPFLITTLVGLIPVIATTIVTLLPMLLQAGITLFMALIDALVTVVPDLLLSIIGMLPDLLSTLLGMLPSLLATGIELFFSLVTAILTVLPDLITTLVGDVLPSLIITLADMIPDLLDTAVELFGALVDGLIENGPELVRTLIFDVIPKVISALAGAVPKLVEAGAHLIGGLIEGIVSMAGKLIDTIRSTVTDALPDFVRDALGIHSPSRVFMEIGAHTANGMALGLEKGAARVAEASKGLIPSIPDVHASTSLGLDAGDGIGSLAGGGTNVAFEYHQHGGEGLTGEQEVRRAARRLKQSIRK